MSVKRQSQDWEELANLDAYWAILSSPQGKYGKWNMGEFFRSGEVEIAGIMAQAEQLGYPTGRERALDFGCGVGRLTRALSQHFRYCDGVDISEAMIAKARELNGTLPDCTFTVNKREDLDAFPDDHFDLIYTSLVLQHLPNRQAILSYLAEFIRTLKADGMLVFQLPRHIAAKRRLQPRRRAYSFLRALGFSEHLLYNRLGLNPIRMSFIPENEVDAFLRSIDAQILHSVKTSTPDYESATYYVTHLRHTP
jgi:ubiquinone/menaquinone biosynthesis C-methylase UbiE